MGGGYWVGAAADSGPGAGASCFFSFAFSVASKGDSWPLRCSLESAIVCNSPESKAGGEGKYCIVDILLHVAVFVDEMLSQARYCGVSEALRSQGLNKDWTISAHIPYSLLRHTSPKSHVP